MDDEGGPSMTRIRVTPGQYTLIPQRQQYAIPGTFPKRFWDVEFLPDEEEECLLTPGNSPYQHLRCNHCKRHFVVRKETYERIRPVTLCYSCYLNTKKGYRA